MRTQMGDEDEDAERQEGGARDCSPPALTVTSHCSAPHECLALAFLSDSADQCYSAANHNFLSQIQPMSCQALHLRCPCHMQPRVSQIQHLCCSLLLMLHYLSLLRAMLPASCSPAVSCAHRQISRQHQPNKWTASSDPDLGFESQGAMPSPAVNPPAIQF